MMLSSLNKIKEGYKNIIFLLVSVIVLQLSFNYNFFNAVDKDFFSWHQQDSEALVIGKMINSQQDRIFNEYVLGWYGGFQDTYQFYLKNIKPTSDMGKYHSSFGLQGYFYSALDSFLNIFTLKQENKLAIMYFLTSFMACIAFAVFAYFIKREFGLFTAIVMIIGIIYSQWLVVSTRNLYWTFFLMIIPFIYSWASLKNTEEEKFIPKKFYLIISVMIFIKCLTGFEYLSTIFISLIIPYVYFSIKNDWGIRLFVKRIVIIYIYAFFGFFSAVFVYLAQKALIFGSLKTEIHNFIYIIKKRTYANSDQVEPILRESIESNIGEVILKYWNGTAFDLYSIFGKFTIITFGEIIIFFIIISLLFLILHKKKAIDNKILKKQVALLSATWISILGPLSWYVLAKGHSYIHTHVNNILWYVPFTVFIFIFVAYLFITIKYKKITKKNYFLITLILIFMIIITIYINDKENDKDISTLINNSSELKKLENGLSVSLNIKTNQLVYFYKDCKGKDLKTIFFLHIYPIDLFSLPNYRMQYRFDNITFVWEKSEIRNIKFFSEYKNSCIAILDLPKYSIKSINTGQYDGVKNLWQTDTIIIDAILPNKIQVLEKK